MIEQRVSRGATADIAAFACAIAPTPAGHSGHVARALLDTMASGLAATRTDPDTLLRRWVEREGGTGRSTVWTSGQPASAAQAALLNATAAHALDWDDVSPGSAMHPSAVLFPALLAIADDGGADGPAIVSAHDVGAAVFRAVAQALPRAEHYRRGWHTTSTVGRLAAVAALANLVHLNEAKARNALGLCASMASGSLANFGTMTKPLHAGLAARDAVLAIQLAADGFTANEEQLEASGGFFAVFGDPAAQRLTNLPDELEAWRTRWSRDWAQKRHPACYATHRGIDAILELRESIGGRIPRRIEVTVEPGGLRPLLTHWPRTATEAKFHMGYVLSVALARGALRLSDFTDHALRDERVLKIMPTVVSGESEVAPIGARHYGDGFTSVRVELTDGTSLQTRVDKTYGDASHPLSERDLDEKCAQGCEARGLAPTIATKLIEAVRAVPWASGTTRLRELLAEDQGKEARA